MAEDKLPRCVKGRDGWRFVCRDPGQTVRVGDYKAVALSRATRGSGPDASRPTRYSAGDHKKNRSKYLKAALTELKEGRYIYGDTLVLLCKFYGVRMSHAVFYQCIYMNQLDVSMKMLRHKNDRGDYKRRHFDGIFISIQELLGKTLGE